MKYKRYNSNTDTTCIISHGTGRHIGGMDVYLLLMQYRLDSSAVTNRRQRRSLEIKSTCTIVFEKSLVALLI